jgi:hypothetical protein
MSFCQKQRLLWRVTRHDIAPVDQSTIDPSFELFAVGHTGFQLNRSVSSIPIDFKATRFFADFDVFMRRMMDISVDLPTHDSSHSLGGEPGRAT